MSSSFALIKFKRTGNIYYGCYNGTSDILIPFIFTPEECYDEKTNCYCAISYGKELGKTREWKFPDNVPDLDEVEIYSDYGYGFYWTGTGSESLRMVKGPLDTCFEEVWVDEKDGQPEWVIEFLKYLEEKT